MDLVTAVQRLHLPLYKILHFMTKKAKAIVRSRIGTEAEIYSCKYASKNKDRGACRIFGHETLNKTCGGIYTLHKKVKKKTSPN